MAADRSRGRDTSRARDDDRSETTIDQYAEEALRSLVRVLAREAARELFAKSCVDADNQRSAEGQT